MTTAGYVAKQGKTAGQYSLRDIPETMETTDDALLPLQFVKKIGLNSSSMNSPLKKNTT